MTLHLQLVAQFLIAFGVTRELFVKSAPQKSKMLPDYTVTIYHRVVSNYLSEAGQFPCFCVPTHFLLLKPCATPTSNLHTASQPYHIVLVGFLSI